MRISDWSSDVCSSDLAQAAVLRSHPDPVARVDVDELDVVAGQRPRVVRLVPPHAHGQAVVAGQAVAGGDPDVAVVVAGDAEEVGGDRKSTSLNSSHSCATRMPSSAWKHKMIYTKPQ